MNVRKAVLVGAVGAWALMGAGCGGSPTTSTATVTAAGPSASGGPSATAATTTTTTGSAHVWAFGDEWTTSPATEAQGSGCAPGAGKLPDGVWFGFIKTWSTSQVAFDMACWWTGAGAVAQAKLKGEDAYDFFITNDSTTVRLVTVAGDIPAKKAALDDGVFKLSQVIADPGGSEPTSSPYPAWIFVNGGEVTELEVQFVP